MDASALDLSAEELSFLTLEEGGDGDDVGREEDTACRESESGAGEGRSDWSCPICLNEVPFVETAIVKGCNHLFCTTCILNWVLFKQESSDSKQAGCICPTCRSPFDVVGTHRHLDGTLSDTLVEESVCLLLRADWFDSEKFVKYRKGKRAASSGASESDYAGLSMSPNTRKLYGADDYMEAAYDNDYEDEDEDYYYDNDHDGGYRGRRGGGSSGGAGCSTSKLVIGNRRWGSHGYVTSGRMYARPSVGGGSSSAGKGKGKKKAAAGGDGEGYEPRYDSTKKPHVGRRAKRALKNKGNAKNALDRAVC